MNAISGDDYSVEFDPATGCVNISGSLRLGGLPEYAPVTQLLNRAMDECDTLTLDLTDLEFLNSSGIAALSKFVINVRDQASCRLVIRGNKGVPWQGKSLNNLKRLMPNLELEFEG